ncbi:MAG: cryptochrome/photolyase family protein [Bacteroidia bacterium]
MKQNQHIGILFPHQLFEDSEIIKYCNEIYLVEEYLFFKQYAFHQMKIAFHRASMKFYETYIKGFNISVHYIQSTDELSDSRKLLTMLKSKGVTELMYIDTTDNWLERRITKTCKKESIILHQLKTPLFLNTSEENQSYFSGRRRLFQTDFYINQRKKFQILLEDQDKPLMGKWSFDADNRLKYPKGKIAPRLQFPPTNEFIEEAIDYVHSNFAENPGEIHKHLFYPITFEDSKKWLLQFLESRLKEFGEYEDALVNKEHFLHHSVLTPMLNSGLISPAMILKETLEYANLHEVPINSLEGFIRQIIGWREFIRAVYELKGTEERTRNYWNFTRSIPASFYNGTTGIEPIDSTIKKVLKTGYCHHIERLMVLGNFMLLCEFNPDEVYKWFMELFIDAYDWVMVTNVYGMSQFADGGLMATKPYISGSNYLMKMSNYEKGEWQKTWDALFWHFMNKQRHFFLQNPRLGMLVKTFDKMSDEKRNEHLRIAHQYLAKLDQGI